MIKLWKDDFEDIVNDFAVIVQAELSDVFTYGRTSGVLYKKVNEWTNQFLGIDYKDVLTADFTSLQEIVTQLDAINNDDPFVNALPSVYEKFAKFDRGIGENSFTGLNYIKLISEDFVCPFCNEQTLNLRSSDLEGQDEDNEDRDAQFDHFFPQSKYPLLSVSVYNLVPICIRCNKKKGTQPIESYPFEDRDISPLSTFDFDFDGNLKPYLKVSFSGRMKSNDHALGLSGKYLGMNNHFEWLMENAEKYNNDYGRKILETMHGSLEAGLENHFNYYIDPRRFWLRRLSKMNNDLLKKIFKY